MNAKKAKHQRQQARMATLMFGEGPFTHDPADSEKPFQCACGELVARPSYSPHKGWVTERHGDIKVEWGPFRAKSGVIYQKPVRIVQVCTAFDKISSDPINRAAREMGDPEPSPAL